MCFCPGQFAGLGTMNMQNMTQPPSNFDIPSGKLIARKKATTCRLFSHCTWWVAMFDYWPEGLFTRLDGQVPMSIVVQKWHYWTIEEVLNCYWNGSYTTVWMDISTKHDTTMQHYHMTMLTEAAMEHDPSSWSAPPSPSGYPSWTELHSSVESGVGGRVPQIDQGLDLFKTEYAHQTSGHTYNETIN